MKKLTFRTLSLILSLIMLFSLSALASGCETKTPGDQTSDPVPESTAGEDIMTKVLEADVSKYTLIRPAEASDKLVKQISVLHQKLLSTTPVDGYRDDFYKEGIQGLEIGEYEILVGKTNRPESKSFLADLKYNDYGFALVGKKIVIAGHSEEATINAIQEFIFAVIHNKNKEEGVFYASEFDFLKKLEYKVTEIFIGDAPASDFRIVYPSRNRNSERATAENIAETIAQISGIVIDVLSDDEKNGKAEHEILVGSTNRHTADQITEITSKLGPTEAVIKYDGKNIAIFGSTSTAIMVASGKLCDQFDSEKTDKLTVTLEAEKVYKYDDSILSAMSFNVWVSGRTSERDDRVVEMVRNYLPDTVGFQEVNSSWLSVLNSGLKDIYAYVGEGRDGGSSGEYNPIFYKKDIFNLIESGTRWLSDTPDTVSKFSESSLNRIYTYALLEKKSDGTRILVVNTHFDHKSADAREKQAKVLVDYLEKNTEYPVILTGDFNCDSASASYSTIVSSVVKNSYSLADKKHNNSATFTNYGASNKIIDFAFVTPNRISVSSYRVCDEKINGDYPSDHHPVLIEYAPIG